MSSSGIRLTGTALSVLGLIGLGVVYWLSFTWPDVDKWLGTEPDPAAVPRSTTVMNLHGLD